MTKKTFLKATFNNESHLEWIREIAMFPDNNFIYRSCGNGKSAEKLVNRHRATDLICDKEKWPTYIIWSLTNKMDENLWVDECYQQYFTQKSSRPHLRKIIPHLFNNNMIMIVIIIMIIIILSFTSFFYFMIKTIQMWFIE